MGKKITGRTISLSPHRRLVNELLVHAKRVPSNPIERDCQISEIAELREQLRVAPSWQAIFIKAFGIVNQRFPELRRAWIPFPYARIYEHPHCEVAVLVEREWQGEKIVLAAKIQQPENMSIDLIHSHLHRFQYEDIWLISPFRQLLRLAKMPWALRRFLFWSTLYVSGSKRAKRFGTSMISSLGRFGVDQVHPITPLTTYFSFGKIGSDGSLRCHLVYDHRVLDGGTAARILFCLDEILQKEIRAELLALKELELKNVSVLSSKVQSPTTIAMSIRS